MTDAIRVLSIRQPWAWLITSGHKRIENRTWTTDYRGPVLIHAGRRWADEPIESIEKRFNITIRRDLPRGGIVGIAALADVVAASDDPFFSGPYGLVMVGARPLPFTPMRGTLGLRVAPSAIVERLDPTILKQLDDAVVSRISP